MSRIKEIETVLEPEPPENAEEAYTSVVNGVLNNGMKSLTVLGLEDEPMGTSEIYRAALREAGHKPQADNRFIPSKTMPKKYCSQNFVDIGLVGQEEIIQADNPMMEGSTAYSLSDFGRDMQPLIAYVNKEITEAEELNDLSTILGNTSSSGSQRSPELISNILYSIEGSLTNQSDVAEAQDISLSNVTTACRRLRDRGVIELYQPFSEGGQLYTLNQDEVSIDRRAPVEKGVVDLLEAEGTVNPARAAEEFSRSSVDGAIQRLQDKGAIKEVNNLKLTSLGQEAVNLLDNVANIIVSYMGSDADDLDEALEVMPSYINEVWCEYQEDPDTFRQNYNLEVWNNARLNSPYVNALEEQEAQSRIEEILESTEDPISTEDVRREWEKRYSERRSIESIRGYLNESEESSSIQESSQQKRWLYEN